MEEKKDTTDWTNSVLIAELMLRVTSLEKTLIDKGILTQDELVKSSEEIAQKATQIVLEKAQNSKNSEEFVANLEKIAKSKKNN